MLDLLVDPERERQRIWGMLGIQRGLRPLLLFVCLGGRGEGGGGEWRRGRRGARRKGERGKGFFLVCMLC